MGDADLDPRYGQEAPRRYYGKYAGLVTANDPPARGAHRGQVKVQIPGILEEAGDGEGDGDSHQPLEVLAAPAFLPGSFFVPEVKDPVWVEFVAGDINFPIWTGVWYPDNATPVTTDPGDPAKQGGAPTRDQKVIRSSSGHVIELDDTSGSEALIIKDETNQNMLVSSSSGVVLADKPHKDTLTFDASGITLKDDANKNTLTFGAGGITLKDDTHKQSLTFGAGGITFQDDTNSNKITFDASGVTVEASSGITLKCGGTKITVTSGTIQLETAGVTVKIDSSAMDVS